MGGLDLRRCVWAFCAVAAAGVHGASASEPPATRSIRLSTDTGSAVIGRIEHISGSTGSGRTRLVIGPLLEGGVCRETFYVFACVMDPSERDVIRMMQQRLPLTALAVPRNGSCEGAAFFTLVGVKEADGIAIIQAFTKKYQGTEWTPEGAGEALYMRCLKAGLPAELTEIGALVVGTESSDRMFFSNRGDCKEGHYSVSIRFNVDKHGRVSIRMIAADDRIFIFD